MNELLVEEAAVELILIIHVVVYFGIRSGSAALEGIACAVLHLDAACKELIVARCAEVGR